MKPKARAPLGFFYFPIIIGGEMYMKNERWITIHSVDKDGSGEEEMEITVRGTLRGSEEDYCLRFEELFGEGLKSKTEIRVQGRRCASIVRRGDFNSELTVEAGKRHACVYATPYGEMNLGVFAREVFSDMDMRQGGELRLNYVVDYNGSLGAHKKMLVRVGEPIASAPRKI